MRCALVVFIGAVLAACASHRPAPAPVARPVATPVARAIPAPPRSDVIGARPRGMVNCPSAVPGARTAIVETEDGVDLLITATSPIARDEIRRLADAHASLSAPAGLGLHTGRHTGTGRLGYCPIVHTDGTIVTAAHTPAGVRIHMHATGGIDALIALRATVARRVGGLPRGGG